MVKDAASGGWYNSKSNEKDRFFIGKPGILMT
jgi:hypothetical protein